MPQCPSCHSCRTWKDGIRYTREGEIQRYLCRDCGYRFSETHTRTEPSLGLNRLQIETAFNGSGLSGRHQRIHTSALKRLDALLSNRQICVTQPTGMKNLARQIPKTRKAAGATKPDPATIKGKIIEYMWYLKKQGYSEGGDGDESTVQKRPRMLERLVKLGANLWDPENVKEVIARQENWGLGTRIQAKYAYQSFLEMEGKTWVPPRYKKPESLPFVPLEEEIDALINACGKKISIFLHGLKETGADPGELRRVEWTDVNEKTRTININHPVKGHNPRILTISRELIARFQLLPKKSERIFPMSMKSLVANFWAQRKRLARVLNNPRLLKITFTSLRHWKGTHEYHKTRDPYHVKKILGHKHLTTTEIYINIEQAVYGQFKDEEFTTRVATTLEEDQKLIEAGFEYVTERNSVKIYRKRK